jgi:tripartite-type tricarboxylate transporter receptor subunit TctC
MIRLNRAPPATLSTVLVIAAAALAIAGVARAAGAPGKDFSGKTVTYVVATGAGGGYDFYGRLVAKFMQKHLPGSTFVVKNAPGAGHIIGANLIYAAKPNGLTIGTFNTGLIYAQVVGRKGVKYDLAKMSWIGKASSDPRVVIVPLNSPFKTLDDIKASKKTVKFAAGGVGSGGYNDTRMLAEVFGWNYKIITGYRGTTAELAMRRGEIDAEVTALSSGGLFVKNGYGRFIAKLGGAPMAGVQQLSSVVSGAKGKAIAALMGSQGDIARLTAGPPAIPAKRLAALRGAYKAALMDKTLREHARKASRPIDPAFGDDVARRVRAALRQPPETVSLVRKILNVKPPSKTFKGGKILKTAKGGRVITFKQGQGDIKIKVSGSRSKITLGGKASVRKMLKPGMVCTVKYKTGGAKEAITMDCKN